MLMGISQAEQATPNSGCLLTVTPTAAFSPDSALWLGPHYIGYPLQHGTLFQQIRKAIGLAPYTDIRGTSKLNGTDDEKRGQQANSYGNSSLAVKKLLRRIRRSAPRSMISSLATIRPTAVFWPTKQCGSAIRKCRKSLFSRIPTEYAHIYMFRLTLNSPFN